MNSLAKFLGLKLETIILLREQTTGSGTWGVAITRCKQLGPTYFSGVRPGIHMFHYWIFSSELTAERVARPVHRL